MDLKYIPILTDIYVCVCQGLAEFLKEYVFLADSFILAD